MSRGGALLLVALVLMLGTVSWVMTRELDRPASARRPLPPAAAAPAPAAPAQAVPAAVRPKEPFALTRAGLVEGNPGIPVERYGAAIGEYWSEVRGGRSEHAYELYYLLRQCEESRRYVEQASGETREALQRRVDQCAAVQPELMGKAAELLDLAASRGDVRAQTVFGSDRPARLDEGAGASPLEVRGWQSKAVGYWQAAADRGSAGAMGMLSTLYRDGGYGIEPDPAMALAYYLSLTALAPRWSRLEVRQSHEARVSPEQRDRAFEAHREIMARCCEALP